MPLVAQPVQADLHPGFLPYRRLRDELLGLPAAQWIGRCSLLARERDLRSAGGAPISFAAGGEAGGALAYESAILLSGRVSCRTEGRGAMHDLHNALVWLTFPKIKSALNSLHFPMGALRGGRATQSRAASRGAVGSAGGGAGGDVGGLQEPSARGRGRVRDAVTLLDESGLLWLSHSSPLDDQLRARNWRGLLIENRALLQVSVMPIIIGHGLLEKLGTPYKAMTAHCLVCNGCRIGARPAQWAIADWAAIDALVAARIEALFAQGAPVLCALPVMGLPGWDPANNDPSYYDDARVFRL